MQIDLFEEKYNEFERNSNSFFDRNKGIFKYNKQVLNLLCLLNSSIKSELTLIPNGGTGDIALCADKSDVYFASTNSIENVKMCPSLKYANAYLADFIDIDIVGKYQSIILNPPIGVRDKRGNLEELYIEKSLSLLAEDGVAIILVQQNFLTAPAYRKTRERIIQNFSLEAVISLRQISEATSAKFSILMVKNRKQINDIFMSLEDEYDYNFIERYQNNECGFFVSAKDVFDRFDANYYDPKYKDIRIKIQSRDTMKLGELADIFSGYRIPSDERKKYGEYLIIKPRNLYGGEVSFDKYERVYCSKEFVNSNIRNKKSIVRDGDVLISTTGAITWAIYRGEDDYAIVNQDIAIIRGKKEYDNLLKSFFFSYTGIKTLKSQLKFIEHGAVLNHISLSGLNDMYVPDIHTLKTAEKLNKAADIEAKVTALFKELGWEVDECYKDNRYFYDLALKYNGQLYGIVEIKSYKSEQIINNPSISRQLSEMKKHLGNLALYLFVDDEIYTFIEDKLEQLCELPRPGKIDVIVKNVSKIDENGILSIEQAGDTETSLSDRFMVEVITSLNRIENKVDILTEKIEEISKQINGFQLLVEKQLDLALTKDEEERIIQAFSDICTEKILNDLKVQESDKIYNDYKNKLIESFGIDAWNKMDDSSKTFLISSKVMYMKLDAMGDIVDYSGVCLLVTKALEVEMNKRLCKNFVAYLKEKYPGKNGRSQFPTALLNEYGKPLSSKKFTLGSIAYVLCYSKDNNNTDEQNENNKRKLIEYSKAQLFEDLSDDEIFDLLQDYAESIEEVRNDYRNPSAHTNELKKIDAQECFDLVIDVEKLLKKMLDSFIA